MKIMKKPIVVDAWLIDTAELQYHGEGLDWVHDEYQANNGRLAVVSDGDKMVLRIRTLEGMMTAQDGDVLVRGVAGELYAIKWEIFMKTYDIVDEQIDDTDSPVSDERPKMSGTNLNVVTIDDLEDGGANVVVDMDYETLKIFAKMGLHQAFIEAAERIVKEHGNS